jgi:hypothetical protein
MTLVRNLTNTGFNLEHIIVVGRFENQEIGQREKQENKKKLANAAFACGRSGQ